MGFHDPGIDASRYQFIATNGRGIVAESFGMVGVWRPFAIGAPVFFAIE
jgi:hypothetical protein